MFHTESVMCLHANSLKGISFVFERNNVLSETGLHCHVP